MRVLVSLSLLLAACGGSSKPAPAAASAPAPAPAEGPDDVEILDRGAEPRVLLRYRVPAGTHRSLGLTFDMTTEAPGVSVQFPSIAIRGAIDFLSADAADVVDTRWRYDAIDVQPRPGGDPSVDTAMRGTFEKLEGAAFWMTMNDRGRYGDVRIDEASPPGAAEVLSTMNMEYSASLPRTPVGVGARWRVPQQKTNGGVRIVGGMEWTLVDLEGSVATLRASMTFEGSDDPGSVRGTGVTDLRIDLADHRGEMRMAMDIQSTTPAGSGRATMTMAVRFE